MRGYFGRLINFDLQLFFTFESENIISGLKKVRGMPLVSASDFIHVPTRAASQRPPAFHLLAARLLAILPTLARLSTSSPLCPPPSSQDPTHPGAGPTIPTAPPPRSPALPLAPGGRTVQAPEPPFRPAPPRLAAPRRSAPRPLAPPPTPGLQRVPGSAHFSTRALRSTPPTGPAPRNPSRFSAALSGRAPISTPRSLPHLSRRPRLRVLLNFAAKLRSPTLGPFLKAAAEPAPPTLPPPHINPRGFVGPRGPALTRTRMRNLHLSRIRALRPQVSSPGPGPASSPAPPLMPGSAHARLPSPAFSPAPASPAVPQRQVAPSPLPPPNLSRSHPP